MSVTLSVKSLDSAGVTYANPAKPDMTIRFKFSGTTKTLNGVQVPNHLTEIIVNDNNAVTVGGVAAVDAISIRVKVSGAFESKARLASLIGSLAAQLGTWETESVMQGFKPSTAPVIAS